MWWLLIENYSCYSSQHFFCIIVPHQSGTKPGLQAHVPTDTYVTNVEVHVPTTNVDVHVPINYFVTNVEDLGEEEHSFYTFDDGDILNDGEENIQKISFPDLEKMN